MGIKDIFAYLISEVKKMQEMIGRQVVVDEKEKNLLKGNITLRPAMTRNEKIRCTRCGSSYAKDQYQLQNGANYCPNCIQFGRITSFDWLASEDIKEKMPREVAFTWKGQLTSAQNHVSKSLVKNVTLKKNSLVWAVTGSGKTEMIFPVIQAVLSTGGRVAIASPRIDVCRELFPRLEAVFPKENALLLYGDSEEKYRFSYLTICTIHQFANFYHAFDLVVIDEIDAFPYEGDLLLHFFVSQAIKKDGQFIYLTATPPNHLLEEIKDDFSIEKLPIRFHKRPLIVPELIWYENWQHCYSKRRRLKKFISYLNELLIDNDVLVFCPSISYMQALYHKVKLFLPEMEMTSVSSQDERREEKVQNMRDKKYRVLFTTTILERGVTFERVSVIIMGSNHPVYSKSALVQIVGRVDRKGEFHNGRAIFFYNQMTTAIKSACVEIKEMNQLAKRWQTDAM